MIVTSSGLVIARTMVSVIMVLGVVVKVLVRAAEAINMVVIVEVLTIDLLADVEIMVVGAIVIAFKFDLAYSVADMDVDLFMGALAGAMLGDLPGIDVADVSANAFAVAITALEFPVPTPLEEFSR